MFSSPSTLPPGRPDSPPFPFQYDLFGLRVASQVELPELVSAAPGPEVDVHIRLGLIPAMEGERHDGFAVTPEGALLNVPRAGRYLIRDGREIVLEPDPTGAETNRRLYLLGSAFGVILHQRNLLPLHANSIEISGSAIAFLGHSGAGKSTMAAWFHDRGFNVLADDVCVVTTDGNGPPLAQPGIPRLRLWRDALEASGRTPEGYELSFDDMDKYNVPTRPGEAKRPLPLGAVYLLDSPNPEIRRTSFQRLTGVAALEALVSNTYRGAYVQMLGGTQRHLSACIAMARMVPVFAISRVWGRDHIDAELAALEDHARSVLRAGSEPAGKPTL